MTPRRTKNSKIITVGMNMLNDGNGWEKTTEGDVGAGAAAASLDVGIEDQFIQSSAKLITSSLKVINSIEKDEQRAEKLKEQAVEFREALFAYGSEKSQASFERFIEVQNAAIGMFVGFIRESEKATLGIKSAPQYSAFLQDMEAYNEVVREAKDFRQAMMEARGHSAVLEAERDAGAGAAAASPDVDIDDQVIKSSAKLIKSSLQVINLIEKDGRTAEMLKAKAVEFQSALYAHAKENSPASLERFIAVHNTAMRMFVDFIETSAQATVGIKSTPQYSTFAQDAEAYDEVARRAESVRRAMTEAREMSREEVHPVQQNMYGSSALEAKVEAILGRDSSLSPKDKREIRKLRNSLSNDSPKQRFSQQQNHTGVVASASPVSEAEKQKIRAKGQYEAKKKYLEAVSRHGVYADAAIALLDRDGFVAAFNKVPLSEEEGRQALVRDLSERYPGKTQIIKGSMLYSVQRASLYSALELFSDTSALKCSMADIEKWVGSSGIPRGQGPEARGIVGHNHIAAQRRKDEGVRDEHLVKRSVFADKLIELLDDDDPISIGRKANENLKRYIGARNDCDQAYKELPRVSSSRGKGPGPIKRYRLWHGEAKDMWKETQAGEVATQPASVQSEAHSKRRAIDVPGPAQAPDQAAKRARVEGKKPVKEGGWAAEITGREEFPTFGGPGGGWCH